MILALVLAAVAETSTIAIPIRTTLTPLLPSIEAQVPKTFKSNVVESGIEIEYDITRDPIALQMTPTGLRARTVVRYTVQGCVAGRAPCVSCGLGEPRRQAVVSLHSSLAWDSSWRLRSVTEPDVPTFPNRCRVTWFDLDITDRVIAPVVDRQLRQIAVSIDRNTPNLLALRPHAANIWSALQTPVEIAPRTWLVFEPLEAGLSPLRGQGANVSTTLALRATTRVVVGDRPTAAAKPLPALRNAEWPAGLRIPIDLDVPYAEASRLANDQFGAKTFRAGSTTYRFDAIRVLPGSGGRIAVEATLDYRGGRLKRYAGPVRLEGTPRYDTAASRVVIPDLDYSLDPKHRSLFVSAAEAFAHDTVRDRLRQSIAFPLAAHLATVREEVSRALTRPIARGATMSGAIDTVVPQTVAAEPQSLRVHVVVTGKAEVKISP